MAMQAYNQHSDTEAFPPCSEFDKKAQSLLELKQELQKVEPSAFCQH